MKIEKKFKFKFSLPGLADCGGWDTLDEAICCDDTEVTEDGNDDDDDDVDDNEDDCGTELATVCELLPPPWTALLAWDTNVQ